MSKIIVPIEMPETCSGCLFHSPNIFIPALTGHRTTVGRCQFSPESAEDPWRDVQWQMENKEDWCPLKRVESEDSMTKFERDGMEEYERVWYEED